MAINKTKIANSALIEIGSPMITSLEEDSEQARLINTRFDELLDEEVARADWTFATARAQLAALSTSPVFGWTYQHQLPSDCLRVIEEVNDYEYIVEGKKILSDDSPLQIKYIKRITDLNELSPGFVTAFVFRLAKFLAIPLRGSGKLRDRMEKEYLLAAAKAESKDSQQNNYPDQAEGDWLDAKGGL